MKVKTIFEKIASWLKKALGSEATWERTASATLTVVAPLLETVITLTAGEPVAAAAEEVINQVESDLAAANALIAGAGPTASVTSILGSVSSNLETLITDLDIKDPAKKEKVTSVVQMVIQEIEQIAKAIPTAVPAAA